MSLSDMETRYNAVPEVISTSRPQGILRRALTSFCHAFSFQKRHEAPYSANIDSAAMTEPIDSPDGPLPLGSEREVTMSNQAAVGSVEIGEVAPEQKPEATSETKDDGLLYCCVCFGKYPREKLVNPCKTAAQDLWCGGCLKRAFMNAIQRPNCMPAKCHTLIQLQYAMPHISEEVASTYQKQFDLWSTKDRVFCPISSCSAFIAPRLIDASVDKESLYFGKLQCPQCQVNLCSDCYGLAHPDLPCSVEDVDEETLTALTRWGYKRCPKCRNGVKRMFGCRQMRCICGASWCWICSRAMDICDGDCEYEDEDDDIETVMMEPDPWHHMLEEGIELPRLFNEEYSLDSPPPAEETPTPAPRQRLRRQRSNLDDLPEEYWRTRELNLGDEPTSHPAEDLWCCTHIFGRDNLETEIKDDDGAHNITEFHCHRCWEVCDIKGVSECIKCWLICCQKCVARTKETAGVEQEHQEEL